GETDEMEEAVRTTRPDKSPGSLLADVHHLCRYSLAIQTVPTTSPTNIVSQPIVSAATVNQFGSMRRMG
ncbi:MAG: hypothetical protein ACLP3R_15325, partial [Candidatus Korobacteraceae bacterium]